MHASQAEMHTLTEQNWEWVACKLDINQSEQGLRAEVQVDFAFINNNDNNMSLSRNVGWLEEVLMV